MIWRRRRREEEDQTEDQESVIMPEIATGGEISWAAFCYLKDKVHLYCGHQE